MLARSVRWFTPLRWSRWLRLLVLVLALGLPTNAPMVAAFPPLASTPGRVTSLAVGGTHSCAVVAQGVQCWGNNRNGELGDGTTTDRRAPVAVTGLQRGVTAVAAGSRHSCAIVNGGVQCWGSNSFGQLGDGTTTQRQLKPVSVVELGPIPSWGGGLQEHQ